MNATAEQIKATPGTAAWVGLMAEDCWRRRGSGENEGLQRLPEYLAVKYLCKMSSNVNEPALIVENTTKRLKEVTRTRKGNVAWVWAL